MSNVTLPSDESVTPRHVKPLLPEMKSGKMAQRLKLKNAVLDIDGEIIEERVGMYIVADGGKQWRVLKGLSNVTIYDPNVTLPSDESVTPRHVKPLLPEMKSGNICECCGKAFETARRHAATCSDKCRKRRSRGQCK